MHYFSDHPLWSVTDVCPDIEVKEEWCVQGQLSMHALC